MPQTPARRSTGFARSPRSGGPATALVLVVLATLVTSLTSTVPATAATTTSTAPAPSAAPAAPVAAVAAAPRTPARPDYRSLQPARLADTRPGQPTIDGRAQGTGLVSPGAPLVLTVAGRAGVPAAGQVTAVALNVTALESRVAGAFVTVYPANEGRPLASNLNVDFGQAVANSVVAKLSPSGQVRIFVSAAMHIIVDVAGYWTTGGIAPLSPARLADTRAGAGTVDGQFAGIGRVTGGTALQLKVAGRGGVAAAATSVALNIVVTGATGGGFLTAYASGKPVPLASNLNFTAGATTANQVIAPIGAGGRVALYVSTSADVLVDVSGYFTTGSDYVGLSPARVADTRLSGQTVPGPPGLTARNSSRVGPIGVGRRSAQLDVLVYGRAGLPTGGKVGAVVLNVTIANPTSGGYLSVFPTGSRPPNASNVNVVAGQTRPNLVIAKVGRGGAVSLITSIAATDLIVDVMGYIPAVSPARQLPFYDWISTGLDGGPVSFDRCSRIRYQYSRTNAPAFMVADLESAIAQIETVTGLDFVRVADTTDSPERNPLDAAGHAKPVIIGFGTDAQFPTLGGSVVGYAGPYTAGSWDVVRFSAVQSYGGFAIFDVGDPSLLAPGFGTGATFGKVALHELGHLIGLGHVDNTAEIMNPFVVTQGVGKYGPGDTLGLRVLYRTQDCPGSAGTFGQGTGGVAVPDFGNRQSGVVAMP